MLARTADIGAWRCSSDADCPEGQSCAMMSSDASVGACIDSPSSSEDADTASESAEEGASADEGGEGTDEEVSSGCQGSQSPAGLALFALGLIGFAVRSRRLHLER